MAQEQLMTRILLQGWFIKSPVSSYIGFDRRRFFVLLAEAENQLRLAWFESHAVDNNSEMRGDLLLTEDSKVEMVSYSTLCLSTIGRKLTIRPTFEEADGSDTALIHMWRAKIMDFVQAIARKPPYVGTGRRTAAGSPTAVDDALPIRAATWAEDDEDEKQDLSLMLSHGSPVVPRSRSTTRTGASHTLVFGSCFTQEAVNRDTVVNHEALRTFADLPRSEGGQHTYLLLGDNVYIDKSHARPLIAYEQLEQLEPYRYLRSKSAGRLLATWCDNDYKPELGDEVRAAFLDFWRMRPFHTPHGLFVERYLPLTTATTPFGLGNFGERAQLLIIDGYTNKRTASEVGADGEGEGGGPCQILGMAQLARLEAALRQPAAIRFVASPFQVLNPVGRFSCFQRYCPTERMKLIRLLRTVHEPVVLLSGDRHIGAFFEMPGQRHRIVEMTSSSLTHSWFNATDELEDTDYTVGGIVTTNNAGRVEIDATTRTVSLELVAMDPPIASSSEVRHPPPGTTLKKHTISF